MPCSFQLRASFDGVAARALRQMQPVIHMEYCAGCTDVFETQRDAAVIQAGVHLQRIGQGA